MNLSLTFGLVEKAKENGITVEQALNDAVAKYVGVPLPGYCPKCMYWNNSSAKYCNQCGNKLGVTA